VFDGDTGQLITAVLRPGTAHASTGALAGMKRLVRRLRARWPQVRIELRAELGFALPAVYDYCEDHRVRYTIGLAANDRLEAMAAPLADTATHQRAETGEQVRLFDEGAYQAGTWRQERRVIYQAEVLEKGLNTRFVVTTRDDPPEDLYHWYTQRGDHPELSINDLEATTASPIARAVIAPGPTSSGCCCTVPPTGSSTHFAAGWLGSTCRTSSSAPFAYG
jgi:hypothetical protein